MLPCRTLYRVLLPSPGSAGPFSFVRRGLTSASLPEFTKNRYPVKRGGFAVLNDTHLHFFTDLLGSNRVITDPSDCEPYNVDWIKNVRGTDPLLLMVFDQECAGVGAFIFRAPHRAADELGLVFDERLASPNSVTELGNARLKAYIKEAEVTRLLQTHLDKPMHGLFYKKIEETGLSQGCSQCVLKPKNTEEVSRILAFCNEHRIAVCPQGGNTGLVGGSVPVFDEVVLSTALMNEIISVDDMSGVLVCQAGCILEHLEDRLAEHGLMMPLDLGAKGSCHIGGNVSTNAGGLRLLRYGNLQGNVLGIEAVKANGEVVDCLSTLKKDNTGYHLKHLFIGSEGSLGVVTKVAIHCPPKPKAVNLAFLGLNSFENVLKMLKKTKHELGEILSSCEMIDDKTLDVVTGHLKLQNPISQYPFYMLIETQGSHNEHDEEKLNTLLERAMEEGIVLDGTATNEENKIQKIWELRERITEGFMHDGYVFKYDISLPIEHFYSLVPAMKKRLGDRATRVSGYGHLGDGNIHLTISVEKFSQEILSEIEPYVFELTSQLKGSISAEHGVGFKKSKYIHYSKSPESIALMKQLKFLLDPNGILNPYKVLPP